MKEQPGLTLVGDAAETTPLLQQIKDAGPDVILLDWELPDFTPTVLLTSLRQASPRLWVICLSSQPDVRSAALAAGADAFVCKSDPPQALLAALGDGKTSRK